MLSRMLGLAVLLAGEMVAVVGLHLLGELPWFALPFGDVSAWLTTSAPGDVAMALLRLVALGGAYWLALSTVAYALARASRLPAAVRGAGWMTLPVVRRVADRAVAVTMATSLVGGSPTAALAAVGGSAPTELPDTPLVEEIVREPEGQVPSGAIPPPLLTPESLPDPTPAETPPGPAHAADAAKGAGDAAQHVDGVHVVEPGENLWSIAATQLAEGSPRDVSQLDSEEIAPHWEKIVADNRAQLRSGDPDLIYPGERIELSEEQ